MQKKKNKENENNRKTPPPFKAIVSITWTAKTKAYNKKQEFFLFVCLFFSKWFTSGQPVSPRFQ